METIVLNKTLENIREYKANFIPDGGVMHSDNLTKAAYIQAIGSEMQESILFSYLGTAAMSIREDGIYNYVEKVYDTSVTGDGEQTTEISQPYQFGIAPTERKGMLNPNGDSRYITHPEISFGATEAWSVTTCFNYDGSGGADTKYPSGSGNTIDGQMTIRVNAIGMRNVNGSISIETPNISGRNVVATIVANGDDSFDVYLDGIHEGTITSFGTVMSFSNIILGRSESTIFNGTISAHIIRNIALSAEQVANEAALLQSIYPEIPSVTIGSQEWATSDLDVVATPQGTVIPEMQEAANVEKVINIDDREFNSDTGFWGKFGVATITGGKAVYIDGGSNTYSGIYANILTIGSWYKITFDILDYVSGSVQVMLGGVSVYTVSANGTYTIYKQVSSAGSIEISRDSSGGTFSFSIDNVSVEEVGWSGSQDLYTGLVAQGESVYDATKAAAMWCYYNNDSEIGSVYSKLYNWFSASLIQLDIDLYNTANPTEHWGWHIPSQAEFTTLQTTLGGSTVAGGKMKVEGEDYWSSPNTGATNSSGFTALGSGQRQDYGGFLNIKGTLAFRTQNSIVYYIINTSQELNSASVGNELGYSIRLIKD